MSDDERRYYERLNERTMRKIRNSFARGTLSRVADSSKMQANQVQLLDGEIVDGAERPQTYGVTGVPKTGAECFVAFIGADRSHPIVLAVDDRRYRVKGLKDGEVCIYTDEGDTITLKRDHHIEVVTKHLLIKAEDDVQIETKALHIKSDALDITNQSGGALTAQMTGGLTATGDLQSNSGSVSLNKHTHPGDSGGTTGSPNGGA